MRVVQGVPCMDEQEIKCNFTMNEKQEYFLHTAFVSICLKHIEYNNPLAQDILHNMAKYKAANKMHENNHVSSAFLPRKNFTDSFKLQLD